MDSELIGLDLSSEKAFVLPVPTEEVLAEAEAALEEVEIKCTECNKVISGQINSEIDGDKYCDKCVQVCDCCGKCYTLDEEFTEYVSRRGFGSPDQSCCEKCWENLHECADCGMNYESRFNYRNLDDEGICSACDDRYGTCECCDERYHLDSGRSCDCSSGCDDEESDGLLCHDYKPTPVFFGNPYDGIFFGAELEVEVINGGDREAEVERLSGIKGLEDFIYLKHDGSLDYGIEIVTHPASLEELKKRFDILLDMEHPKLISFKSSSCGFHVHASREPLKGLTIPKIMTFINNKDNFSYIKKLAQRYNDFSKIRNKKITDVKFSKKKYAPKIAYQEQDRYDALNTLNPKTIEFRLFKGTLFKPSIFRYLEFCHAIIKYCWPSNRPIKETYDFHKFIEFVAKERKKYPNLHHFHLNKGPFENTKDTQFPFYVEPPMPTNSLTDILDSIF